MAEETLLATATKSLERIQNFDPDSLRRQEELGRLNFAEVVQPARKVIQLFQRISPSTLSSFGSEQQNRIKGLADSVFHLFQNILDFDVEKSGNAAEERRQLIQQVSGQPDIIANSLWHHISYSVASSLDPTATQQEMRALVQGFHDERKSALDEIELLKREAEEVLTSVRDAAAEQGVSQQAHYFSGMAAEHSTDAEKWLGYSLIMGAVALGFAVLTSFTYRIPVLAPKDGVEAAQLITSKFVILGILAYGLFTCVRNFLSHKHNSVVNRHRQNALLTYTAFVNAAPTSASREIVLTHAAASVFAPQETGYIKQDEPSGGRSIMEMITKSSVPDIKG